MTAVLDRLENKGYVRRVRDTQDRRKVKVEVTDGFLEEAAKIYGPLIREWAEIMSRPTVAMLESMVKFMREANEVKPRHIERVRRGE